MASRGNSDRQSIGLGHNYRWLLSVIHAMPSHDGNLDFFRSLVSRPHFLLSLLPPNVARSVLV